MRTFLAGALAGVLAMSAAAGATARPESTPEPVMGWHPVTLGPAAPVTATPEAVAVVPAVTASPTTGTVHPGRALPRAIAPRPPRAARGGPITRGVASYVNAGLGRGYMAARMPKGTTLRVCGPAGCITGTVNDYGPRKRVFPLDVAVWRPADLDQIGRELL